MYDVVYLNFIKNSQSSCSTAGQAWSKRKLLILLSSAR
ncbi:hypothetical protein CFter6_4264 [Collimonas fungivorans]|uniref:Uncharacterized protein n=1 Tax=Collimonas fungivorans TaxID=158899 RepID=A0A127PGL9_9BURK|nr:hypothetical protein CFter6_4264 [Collimonas fungivorans]